MSFRTVVISNNCKLDLKLNYLTIRNSEEVKQVFIGEIAVLIIESTAVSLTSALLCELIKNKVKVIFCDEKRNPHSQLISQYGAHDSSLKISIQINWDNITKEYIWTEIVKRKIYNQAILLEKLGLDKYDLLYSYMSDVENFDCTNREGHAAKVYFNSLFGLNFCRRDDNVINSALNYGYTILLSAFNREIVQNGYLTQIGIFHKNRFNPFNLSSDFIEPFRFIVDEYVVMNNFTKFEKEEKMKLVNLLNKEVIIEGKKNFLLNSIKIYCKSIFDYLNNECENISFPEYEL